MKLRCGWCGSNDIDYETVDNGVGLQQVTPGMCNRCNASQIGPFEDSIYVHPVDRKRGWYAGPDELQFIGPPDPTTPGEWDHMLRAFLYCYGGRVLVVWFDMTHISYVETANKTNSFRTYCGLVFTTAARPRHDVVTCLTCLCEESA